MALRALGFDPQKPTGIVLFGGHGSKAMLRIARLLDDTQLILVCGHNAALASELRAMPAACARLVVGFTTDLPYYMSMSDFFIGKPGPGSLSEAIQQKLPVIVVRNKWTMPQERYNTDWVLENGVGLVLKSFKTLRAAVADLIGRLDTFRIGISAMRNNTAVFEIPDLFERILNGGAVMHERLPAMPEPHTHRMERDSPRSPAYRLPNSSA